jgi:hypothetical protein
LERGSGVRYITTSNIQVDLSTANIIASYREKKNAVFLTVDFNIIVLHNIGRRFS